MFFRRSKRVLREVVESGHYDNRSDFTVVAQPFFRDVVLPRLPVSDRDAKDLDRLYKKYYNLK